MTSARTAIIRPAADGQDRLDLRNTLGWVCPQERSVAEPLVFTDVSQGSGAAQTESVMASSPRVQNVGGMTVVAASTPELDDLEPIVVLDDEHAASSALCAASQEYLRAQGIADERTWSAFRLGHIDDVTMKHFGLTGRRGFTSIGVNIPTYDPRDPTTVVGVIRLSHAQNKHGFATPPIGMACTVDVATSSRLILVDNPLLGFRLAQAGVVGVAIVEDPVVLTSLAEWLAAREVVTITSAKHGELVVPSGITPIGTGRMCGLLERASSATLALVGLDRTTLRQPLTPLPLDLRAVRDLHAYAQRQVSTAAGIAALAACDLDQPDVVRAYRIGYVPADVRQAFTPEQRRMFLGRDLGGCVVFPADDEHGAVVDLVVMKAYSTHQRTTLWDAPRGLCAARLSTAFDRVVITTIPKWVGRLFREVGPTMLLRGVDDARVQAPRLAVGGVREVALRCRLNDESDQIAAVLHAVGITVRVVHDPSLKREPPRRSANVAVTPAESAAATVETPSSTPEAVSPPTLPPTPLATPPPSSSPLELVQHDAGSPQAIFRSGAAHYTVQIPWGGMTATQVTVSIGDQRHRDFLDLSMSAQRQRFASCAALRLGIPTAYILDALGALLPAMEKLTPSPASTETSVGVELSPAARAAAMELVRSEHVLERIVSGVESLGWVGEPDTKALVVLAAISRLSPDPLWTVLTATTSGERFPGLGVLAAITPAEHLVHVSPSDRQRVGVC
jgi:hypothetical protein